MDCAEDRIRHFADVTQRRILENNRMGWALLHIAKLKLGETVSFRPKGNSMQGKIESGQLCTVQPCDLSTLEIGDIVLCKVKGREYLHLITAARGAQFQIGNNKGRVNGWVSANAIFGRCIEVMD
jgi:hypothetical protein